MAEFVNGEWRIPRGPIDVDDMRNWSDPAVCKFYGHRWKYDYERRPVMRPMQITPGVPQSSPVDTYQYKRRCARCFIEHWLPDQITEKP